MGFVMKADASISAATATFNFGSSHADLWVTYRLGLRQATIDLFTASFNQVQLLGIQNSGLDLEYLFLVGPSVAADVWVSASSGSGSVPFPVAGWQMCESHYHDGILSEFFIDGVQVWSVVESVTGLADGFFLGATNLFPNDPASVFYFDDVKAGTSRDASDLFFDDFEDGTLDAWTAVAGDMSVVVDPFPPTPPPTVQVFSDLPVRVFVTSLDSETITIMDRRATDKQFLFTLNAPAYHTGQVASDDPEVNTAFPLPTSQANLAQASRLIYALQRQKGSDPPYQCIFGGIATIMEDQGTDAPTTRYTAHDPWQYMMSRPAHVPATSDILIPADGYTYPTGTRASDIAVEQLVLTQAFEGETHIDFGPGDSFPLVEETDPLPGPFTIDQGMTVGEVWTALTETGTIDIHLPPIYDPDARPGKVVKFQTVRQSDGVAAGPVLYDIVMAWDKPGNSLMGINNLIDATRLANRAQFITSGGVSEIASDPASEAVYGIYYAQQTFPGISDPLIVALLAVAEVTIRRNGARTVTFDPAPERVEQPFKDYNLGDYLPVWASRNLRQPLGVDYDSFDANNPGASGYQRIYAIPLAVDDNGVSRVTGLLTSKEN